MLGLAGNFHALSAVPLSAGLGMLERNSYFALLSSDGTFPQISALAGFHFSISRDILKVRSSQQGRT